MKIVVDKIAVLQILEIEKKDGSGSFFVYGATYKDGTTKPLSNSRGYVFLNQTDVENIQMKRELNKL